MNDTSDHIALTEPSERLLQDVLLRIREERELTVVQRRFIIFSILFLSSALGLVSVGLSLSQAFSQSGFTQIFSLAFSDGGAVFSAWQDFGYSLLEALPVMPLILLLGMAVIFFSSLQYLVREFKRVIGSMKFVAR